jgi:NhaP-type Na+/H+ and K+/H+ antiporters
MIEIAAFVLVTTGFSLFIQDKFKIPLPITLLLIAIFLKSIHINAFNINNALFDEIIIVLLPILISVDVLNLKMEDIKKNAISLFYIAAISVLLSIGAGLVVNKILFPSIEISNTSLTLLLCMIMATDPIATSAIFNNFKVPHKLKVLAEGESLFNDATALIIFTIMLNFLNGQSMDLIDVSRISFIVVFGAVLIGILMGTLGLFLLSFSKNPLVETVLLLSISFISFIIAEHFHVSGILSIIVSILMSNHIITKRIEQNNYTIVDVKTNFPQKVINKLSSAVETKLNHNLIKANIQFIALIGTVILFLSIGNLINIQAIIKYWKEIIIVFLICSLIRALMMAKFALISGQTRKMQSIPVHWYLVLSSAGVKGGLSILMLHMLPKNFEYKELFDAIVIGNILIGTIIYPFLMTCLFKFYKEKFENDCSV